MYHQKPTFAAKSHGGKPTGLASHSVHGPMPVRAEATIAAATKEIPEKDKIIAEATAELAKLQPQLDPMRAKVKQMTDQYFTMLPK